LNREGSYPIYINSSQKSVHFFSNARPDFRFALFASLPIPMKIKVLLFGLTFPFQFLVAQDTKFPSCAFADPFWGADGGNVFVGACSPFGLVRLGPDVPFPAPTSGYKSDKPILGFSHNHLSGTGGGGRYGNLMLTPQLGKPIWAQRAAQGKEEEKASPGLYQVTLLGSGGKIKTELTAFQNVGRTRFQVISESGQTNAEFSILMDLAHCNGRTPATMFQGCRVSVGQDGSFSGQSSFKGGWGGDNPYTVFFSGQTNLKSARLSFKTDTTWDPIPASVPKGKKPVKKWSRIDTTGFAFSGTVAIGEWVETSIALSYKDLESSKPALQKSLATRFEDDLDRCRQAWEDRLSVLSLPEGNSEQKQLLYSALYHTLIMPADVSGLHPGDAYGEAHFWDHYCLWDVFRCLMPLHNLLYPGEQKRMAGSLIRIGEKTGWLPDAWIAGDFAMAQGGCNAEIVLSEAQAKGILLPSEAAKAFSVCYANATKASPHPEWYGRSDQYRSQGFCDAREKNGTSRSLEYAYNDFILSRMAKRLGKLREAKELEARSYKVLNLWYPERRFFWSKDSTGAWMPGFTPEFIRPDHWNGPYFYEGNGWLYALGAPHLADTLIALHGGKTAFLQRVDTLFSGNHFDMGNEPGFLLPYAPLLAGNRAMARDKVHQLANEKFVPGRKGLPGQDDSGALSSWLIWAFYGLYPLAGTTDYMIIPPLHGLAEMKLPGGNVLKVKGKGLFPYWNGKPWKEKFFQHEMLIQGGNLEWKDK
jgi:predicted alpha-1,2-mannosidase